MTATTCIRCGRILRVGQRCWRHGTTPRRLRSSKAWQQLRAAVVAAGRCSSCGLRTTDLEADHIRPASSHPQLALDPANVRPLCRRCHQQRQERPYSGR